MSNSRNLNFYQITKGWLWTQQKNTPTDRESVGALWVGLRPDEKWPYPLNTLAQGR